MHVHDKASVIHGVETLGAFALAAFLAWLFHPQVVSLFDFIVGNDRVASAMATGFALVLGAFFSALAKKFRADPDIPVPDYVNGDGGDKM